MSDYDNPYVSPETPIVPETAQKSGVELTVIMLKYLNEASPWLRFIGIMGYIMGGLTVLGGIISIISMIAVGSAFNLPSEIGAGFGAIFAIYIPIGILIFFPAHFTFTFGNKINSYKFTNSITDLEEAFKNNKSYWKFMGILYIIYLAAIPVLLVAAVIAGVASVLGSF